MPDKPLPTITTSATVGRESVVRCPSKISDGWVCQNDSVEFGVGRVA